MKADIIAAIATGIGPAAIGIIRLSGPGCHELVLRLCPSLSKKPPERRLVRTSVRDPTTGKVLDDVLVVFFEAKASYTGEEAAEVHGHGGRVVLERLLRVCLEAGARPARPGEFTRRALANGRLDLVQAEAVAMLADAPTEEAADVALEALSGRPSAEVTRIYNNILDLLAESEAFLDFAEDEGIYADLNLVKAGIESAIGEMDRWLEAARVLRPSIFGYRVALIGRPNAGKSSLFNALLGRPRAIVHEEPGTTRDVVTEMWPLSGIQCVLMDTAGIRSATSWVEAEGIERAMRTAIDCDCVVLVVDASATDACSIIEDVESKGIKVDIVAWHKADQLQIEPVMTGAPTIKTSAIDGRGVKELRDLIASMARKAMSVGKVAQCVIAGDRQVEAITLSIGHLRLALKGLYSGAPMEGVAKELREAASRLAEIIGARVDEEVLDRVFERFCIGK